MTCRDYGEKLASKGRIWCSYVDIQKYNSVVQEDRVYIFMNALDDSLDGTQIDVLQKKPFPIMEQGYTYVRRKAAQ